MAIGDYYRVGRAVYENPMARQLAGTLSKTLINALQTKFGRGRGGVLKARARAKPITEKVDELIHDFGKDKSPKLRASGQVNVKTVTEMKACTEIAAVAMDNGAFTTLCTVQLNSAYEPVDTEAEQPRGFDEYSTFYKRYRVSGCAIQMNLLGRQTTSSDTAGVRQVVVGVTATMAGEAPASLREAMEHPRTVYKVLRPILQDIDGSTEKAVYHTVLEAAFDPAEVFGNRKNYYTLDDVVGFNNSNPATLLIATVWACVVNPDATSDLSWDAVCMTNQKLTWFGAEKLAGS